MLSSDDFPNIHSNTWKVASPSDPKYNCIAFAAGRTDIYWWPDPFPDPLGDYWPIGIPREESIEAFTRLYESLGYETCADEAFEQGFEKIAIYAIGSEPTHAARQLPDGRWVSKLGPCEDIEHETLEMLSGPSYGQPVCFLRKQIPVE